MEGSYEKKDLDLPMWTMHFNFSKITNSTLGNSLPHFPLKVLKQSNKQTKL